MKNCHFMHHTPPLTTPPLTTEWTAGRRAMKYPRNMWAPRWTHRRWSIRRRRSRRHSNCLRIYFMRGVSSFYCQRCLHNVPNIVYLSVPKYTWYRRSSSLSGRGTLLTDGVPAAKRSNSSSYHFFLPRFVQPASERERGDGRKLNFFFFEFTTFTSR